MRTVRRSIRIRAPRAGQALFAALFLLSFTIMMSACGGNTQLQQQVSQAKTQLDVVLQQAQTIGVPAALFVSIRQQEQQLASTNAPFNPFDSRLSNDYYTNLATRYALLHTQAQGVIVTTTEQAQSAAQQAIQNFETALTRERVEGLPTQQFAQQFSQDQGLLASARTPKAYGVVNQKVAVSLQGLDLLDATAAQLRTLNNTIQQMRDARIDVTVMQMQYQSDQQVLASAANTAAFEQLSTLIDAQYQQAIVSSQAALPHVTAARLSEFATQVQLLSTYGVAASAIQPYQQRLAADQLTMSKTKTLQAYQAFSRQIDADIASMHGLLVQSEASYLVKQFHHEVNTWGNAHLFHDAFDGQSYALDAAYMDQGIGSDMDTALSYAVTPDDYQGVVDEVNNALFNLHLFEADYSDKTPYNQVHATDLQMLAHYQLQKQQVLMVSLSQQAMRVYQDGKLINAFLITTGRSELPSVPGIWPTLDRLSPTTFKSPDPPGSPYWYPDTHINYAILYHEGGYFVHDAWWRADFGPGTQFPHYDSGGDEAFAGSGSHGCVNMQEQQAQWVYQNTNWDTLIVIY